MYWVGDVMKIVGTENRPSTLISADELFAYFAAREEEEEGTTAEPSLETCSTNAQVSDAAASSHNTPAEKRARLVSCK